MSKFSVLVVIAILIVVWIFANPREEFGFSFFGLTTYNAVPVPYFDVKIYPSGVMTLRAGKSHDISLNETMELLNSSKETDALIIGTGYDGLVNFDEKILGETFVKIYTMPTPEALKKFNELKEQGKRVAAIIHSTC